MALAKSVDKLLLPASASKARSIVVTWYYMESDLDKRRGPKTEPLFESPLRSLLKSGPLPLDRYGTWKETIRRRLQHMYTPSDTWLEWLGEAHYTSWSRINARGSKLGLLFNSFQDHY